MAKVHASGKRLQIDKANSSMLIMIGIAAFIVSFTIVAGRALLNTRAYQGRIIKQKEVAAQQLKANIEATNSLVTSYKAFVETSDNVIGGNPKGTGERDGDNAKIVLDALPSKYDYPALASSLEKIIAGKNHQLKGIQGTDDEIAQSLPGQAITPVEMPFQVSVDGNFGSAKDLLGIFERSIRPIKVQSLQFDAEDSGALAITADALTYYQPAKTIKIETKEIQ